jgi:demethylmenaquinone methyltransferase/2-methoxy-6-polyprenyl-1,4-benzoquinol methylase
MIEEMQDYYDQRAAIYDSSMGYDRAEVLASHRRIIAHLQNRLSGRAVLEIACGPGFWTQHIAASASRVLATDYNESTLREARKKPLGGNVTTKKGDAYDLSDLPEGFDAAFAGDWLTHVPLLRRGAFLAGLHAKLKPGALVIFCDQTPKEGSITGIRDSEGNNIQTRTLPDGRRFSVIKNFLTEDDFRKLLAPFTSSVALTQFPECRRYTVEYVLKA